MIYPKIEGHAQKTDTIVHVNGNVLKGDLKKMEYGIITWKMDGMGTINFAEPFVSSIISKKQFEIVLKNGLIYYSSFEASDSTGEVIITKGSEKASIKIDDIVEIHPIKGNFWMRFSGNVSLGANYAKSSNLTTVAFSGNLDFRKKKNDLILTWNLNLSFQNDSTITRNSETFLSWQRLLDKQWSSLVSLGTSQNLQLGIKRRYTLSLGALKDITYNTWSRLYLAGAFSVINETSFDVNTNSTQDLAGVIRLAYDIFKYTSPKISLKSNINYIPYFTGDSRSRASLNLTPSISIWNSNFKVGVNFYYTYDSNPPEGSLSNEDIGINLQLTYAIN